MKLKEFINKLQEYDDELDLIFASSENMTEYDYSSVNLVDFKIHSTLDNEPYQLIITID